ncbi:kinase-like domain-containing protein [Chaetomium tenue]|uniref:Kinase-like domain-containing protein n=1 Tax=Chaetomium tenue TaxID=1854479 RepID=A0ACB7PE12_9PEZI|nr:kinase-like domain-containing protein [Chaetomium globosum]
MATRPSLPYYAPDEILPSPIPSVEEILASPCLFPPHFCDHSLHRVGDHFMVKHGRSTGALLQEGENMLFVEQSTSVLLVPKVYAIFSDEKTNKDFLVMEYISGKPLADIWRNALPSHKENITSQFRRGLDELRSIPSPGYYGGIWRQPIRDSNFRNKTLKGPCEDPAISGPHETEEQWIDAMWLCVKMMKDRRWLNQLPRIRKDYHVVFKGEYKPVFTHADLSLDNVMLRDDGVVVVIDWERSGWYPSYWEYCSARMRDEPWTEELSMMLDEYISLVAWIKQHQEEIY